MVDKFGTIIQRGDLIAMVDTYKDNPCVVGVATGGFTPFYTRCNYIHIWGGEIALIENNKLKTRHLVVITEEQLNGITEKIVQKRLEYQEGILGNDAHRRWAVEGQYTDTENSIRAKLQELLAMSNEMKEER